MNSLPSEIGTFLAELRGRGVSVWPDGDLLYIWPATKLTPAELERLRTIKPAVLEYLRRRNEDLLPSEEVCREWRRRYCNTENNHERPCPDPLNGRHGAVNSTNRSTNHERRNITGKA